MSVLGVALDKSADPAVFWRFIPFCFLFVCYCCFKMNNGSSEAALQKEEEKKHRRRKEKKQI